MGPADDVEAAAKASPLYAKYGTRTDSQSAREMLAARLEQPAAPKGLRRSRSSTGRRRRRPEAARTRSATSSTRPPADRWSGRSCAGSSGSWRRAS